MSCGLALSPTTKTHLSLSLGRGDTRPLEEVNSAIEECAKEISRHYVSVGQAERAREAEQYATGAPACMAGGAHRRACCRRLLQLEGTRIVVDLELQDVKQGRVEHLARLR
jgi:hypothetical protein